MKFKWISYPKCHAIYLRKVFPKCNYSFSLIDIWKKKKKATIFFFSSSIYLKNNQWTSCKFVHKIVLNGLQTFMPQNLIDIHDLFILDQLHSIRMKLAFTFPTNFFIFMNQYSLEIIIKKSAKCKNSSIYLQLKMLHWSLITKENSLIF